MIVTSGAGRDTEASAAARAAVLQRAREAGVERIVTIGTDIDSSRRAQALAEANPEIWFSPGIHPHDADKTNDVAALKALAAHPRAVAVGETGLDTVKNYSSIPNQKELFVRHLEIALEVDKPITIHCREPHGDLFPILRAHAPLRGVI